MMFKKCSKFHWSTIRSFDFIKTVYELFDNPSYFVFQSFNGSRFFHFKRPFTSPLKANYVLLFKKSLSPLSLACTSSVKPLLRPHGQLLPVRVFICNRSHVSATISSKNCHLFTLLKNMNMVKWLRTTL